jgi:hypothetical protein
LSDRSASKAVGEQGFGWAELGAERATRVDQTLIRGLVTGLRVYGVAFGVVFSAVFLVELLPANNVFRRGFEDGAEEGFDAAIAKSAARNAKRRELIESAEELPLEIDETPPTPRQRAETARASKTKRTRASK